MVWSNITNGYVHNLANLPLSDREPFGTRYNIMQNTAMDKLGEYLNKTVIK